MREPEPVRVTIVDAKGWRNRRTGTVHCRVDCPAWSRVRAEDVEGVVITENVVQGGKLCRYCFW